jgi:hypothetical protein
VVINATGAGTTYSAYITDCGTTTDLPAPTDAPAARKVLRDGQLLIVIGNNTFTITGQKIQ